MPEPPSELRSGVGPVQSTDDAAEGNEARRGKGPQPERIPREWGEVRTQSWVAWPSNLARVNAAARRAVQTRFAALLHHIDPEALGRRFRRQKRRASAGVDAITLADYEQKLEANLHDLCRRVHTGRYRPQPVRRQSS
jgi:RNA-directed DNA polymerase